MSAHCYMSHGAHSRLSLLSHFLPCSGLERVVDDAAAEGVMPHKAHATYYALARMHEKTGPKGDYLNFEPLKMLLVQFGKVVDSFNVEDEDLVRMTDSDDGPSSPDSSPCRRCTMQPTGPQVTFTYVPGRSALGWGVGAVSYAYRPA